MPLPNPSMSFTPFDPLPASDLNDLVENIEALADGSGLDSGAVSYDNLDTDALSAVVGTVTGTGDLSTSYVSVGEIAGLPAGKYILMATGWSVYSVAQDTSTTGKVRNVTDGTDIATSIISSATDYPGSASDTRFPWSIILPFELAATKTIQIQFVASTGAGTTAVTCSSMIALRITDYA